MNGFATALMQTGAQLNSLPGSQLAPLAAMNAAPTRPAGAVEGERASTGMVLVGALLGLAFTATVTGVGVYCGVRAANRG